MKSKEVGFIKDWFNSDFDIEIEVNFENQKGVIILENNAYYFDGERYKGNKRRIIYDDNYETTESKIYDFLEKNFEEYFYDEYTLEEILEFLEALEENGLKLKVL